jgi:fumarate hydratase class I
MGSIFQQKINEVVYNLLLKAATLYPMVFMERIIGCYHEERNPTAKSVLKSIIDNVLLASEKSVSICQDTGVPAFHVFVNPHEKLKGDITEAITNAVAKATRGVPLRKNVIEPFTFENSGNNTGWGVPMVHYHYNSDMDGLGIRAELKGFGGELKSTYDWIFTSTRSMEDAVLAYVINSILISKGEACLPSFLGVGVGGFGGNAVSNAKNAVFRELNQLGKKYWSGENGFLLNFEGRLFKCVNRLGLGPMGVGGTTTTLGTYVARGGTHTAAAPVAVIHQCWANRASEALIQGDKAKYITRHVEKEDIEGILARLGDGSDENQGRIHSLQLPTTIEKLDELKLGEVVYITGTVCTARDGAHRRLVELLKKGKKEEIPREIPRCRTIYHCGPIADKVSGNWVVNSAGPTTSSRFTDDGAYLVQEGMVNLIIGKGTMGLKIAEAMKGKAVYLKATGGCAVCYGNAIRKVDVKWLELGYPEAVWIFEVEKFGPLIVGIDSHGNSMTPNVLEEVYKNVYQIYEEEGLDPKTRYVSNPLTLAGLSLEEVIQICRKS